MTQALYLSACFIFTMDRMREIDYPLSSGTEGKKVLQVREEFIQQLGAKMERIESELIGECAGDPRSSSVFLTGRPRPLRSGKEEGGAKVK